MAMSPRQNKTKWQLLAVAAAGRLGRVGGGATHTHTHTDRQTHTHRYRHTDTDTHTQMRSFGRTLKFSIINIAPTPPPPPSTPPKKKKEINLIHWQLTHVPSKVREEEEEEEEEEAR